MKEKRERGQSEQKRRKRKERASLHVSLLHLRLLVATDIP